MKFLVTGGAGFIGSAFVRTALEQEWAEKIVVLDALTYAGNLENLAAFENDSRLRFVRGDICDMQAVTRAMGDGVDAIFHFAAESHVDRSIMGAQVFVKTNVLGTQTLIDAARERGVGRFVHVSTDEVYGALALDSNERFTERSPINPTSPYASSKAASDHMVLAAVRTHGLDALITRCSNNYGPYQSPEKFIPLFITRSLEGLSLPLYGDGRHVRDWIHVDDHVHGIMAAFQKGRRGDVYNLGGECERSNREIAEAIVGITGANPMLLTLVEDRPGHDRRYAIDPRLASEALGFRPGAAIEDRLEGLVRWYADNRGWWQRVQDGEYQAYYQKNYQNRHLA